MSNMIVTNCSQLIKYYINASQSFNIRDFIGNINYIKYISGMNKTRWPSQMLNGCHFHYLYLK